ncbi:MAG: cytidylate kinase-like family protein [Planctomycetales bacterium]|nr:cytidylate kinase-like family protein [Planctomycetales bacterium]
MTTPSKSAGAALERYLRHWRERGALTRESAPKKSQKPMTIAISRERGVGGAAIAKAIGEQLDWPVYDCELVELISKDTGIQAQLLESLDEKSTNWLSECLDSFRKEKTIGGSAYASRLVETLFALSRHGNCIFVGRGAAQVLPAKRTLRIRLFAPIEARIKHIANSQNLSAEEASKHIEEVDKARDSFVKKYFHKDVADLHGYDLLFNPLKYGTDRSVEIILLALKQHVEVLGQ